MTIRPLRTDEPPPLNLLLLADPSQEAIAVYISRSAVFVAEYEGQIIGVYALLALDESSVEIKNIAVDPAHQGQGLGKMLLADAAEKAKQSGFQVIYIGTANSSIRQLDLYQKQGFEVAFVKENFFLEHYPTPIYEDGIQCRDMIMLAKRL
jgi:ribosomal protein S18 acetylase RimI-like enzyme